MKGSPSGSTPSGRLASNWVSPLGGAPMMASPSAPIDGGSATGSLGPSAPPCTCSRCVTVW
ncbi:Uncharacterised protein [Mycobacteroides abscessus subsp. abscessus]|nr:Uncharacterised protein [Mycobacteroides abscessus subsp. abscessus]